MKRLTNMRFTAFWVVVVASTYLARMGDLDSSDVKMIFISAIAAFIGAQAYENGKVGATSETPKE